MSQKNSPRLSARAWFRERLDDPELVTRAIWVESLLAVPVGGKRRGGYISVFGLKHAREVMAQMAKANGFPNPWFEPGKSGKTWSYPPNLHWGEPSPEFPAGRRVPEWDGALFDVESGRHYGYSEKSIQEFITERFGPELAQELLNVSVV